MAPGNALHRLPDPGAPRPSASSRDGRCQSLEQWRKSERARARSEASVRSMAAAHAPRPPSQSLEPPSIAASCLRAKAAGLGCASEPCTDQASDRAMTAGLRNQRATAGAKGMNRQCREMRALRAQRAIVPGEYIPYEETSDASSVVWVRWMLSTNAAQSSSGKIRLSLCSRRATTDYVP